MLPRTILISAAAVIAIAGVVTLAWPRPADAAIRASYDQLRAADIPVRVLGWVSPTSAQTEVRPGAYVLTIQDPNLGTIVITGMRGIRTPEGTALAWQDGPNSYSVTSSADPADLAPRIVSLDEATRQLQGAASDTPLLYLWYLPLLLLLVLFGVLTVLVRPRAI